MTSTIQLIGYFIEEVSLVHNILRCTIQSMQETYHEWHLTCTIQLNLGVPFNLRYSIQLVQFLTEKVRFDANIFINILTSTIQTMQEI